MIGHAIVSKGEILKCSLVEVYDETHQSHTACIVRFANGDKHTLAFGQSITSPEMAKFPSSAAGAYRGAA